MRCWHTAPTILLITMAAGGVPADAHAEAASGEPRITAQGFSIDTALVGEAGSFDSVRIRIEAPSRIAKLVISTEEHEIDLAITQDRSLFGLFGLNERPLHACDVTLDVAPYMNDHFTAPATHRLDITVADRAGAAATASFTATVIPDERPSGGAAESAPDPQQLTESTMTLTRQAASDVAPAEKSPLTWITREPVNVTIRLQPADPDAEIRRLDPESWEQVLTRDGLERRISTVHPVPYVDVPAARNGASGTVLAISVDGGATLIRITSSATSLSQLGTTVTLAALVRD